jgi:hypothetical protein
MGVNQLRLVRISVEMKMRRLELVGGAFIAMLNKSVWFNTDGIIDGT